MLNNGGPQSVEPMTVTRLVMCAWPAPMFVVLIHLSGAVNVLHTHTLWGYWKTLWENFDLSGRSFVCGDHSNSDSNIIHSIAGPALNWHEKYNRRTNSNCRCSVVGRFVRQHFNLVISSSVITHNRPYKIEENYMTWIRCRTVRRRRPMPVCRSFIRWCAIGRAAKAKALRNEPSSRW